MTEHTARRRAAAALIAGAGAATLTVAAGALVTSQALPDTPRLAAAAPEAPAPGAQPPGAQPPGAQPSGARIQAALAALLASEGRGERAQPRAPRGGNGWRSYRVVDRQGRSRGHVEVWVYAVTGGPCTSCGRPADTAPDLRSLRYTHVGDVDWQSHQAFAWPDPQGRTVVAQATGPRGTGDAAAGRPPLDAEQVEALAVDPRTSATFTASERCTGMCPVPRVPLDAVR